MSILFFISSLIIYSIYLMHLNILNHLYHLLLKHHSIRTGVVTVRRIKERKRRSWSTGGKLIQDPNIPCLSCLPYQHYYIIPKYWLSLMYNWQKLLPSLTLKLIKLLLISTIQLLNSFFFNYSVNCATFYFLLSYKLIILLLSLF